MRYMDGADGTSVTMRRVYSVANAGNQVKIKGNSLIENSVLVGHCTYFRGKYDMAAEDLCRGDGSTLQLVMTGGDTAIVRGNTIAGEGATQIGHSEGDATDRIVMQDNLVVGFPYAMRPGRRSLFDGGKSPARLVYSGNLGWNVPSCPADTRCDEHPKLANMSLPAFDATPRPGSPVRGKAGAVPCRRIVAER
jgi:hypothetical protein